MNLPPIFPGEKTPGAWKERRTELLRLLSEYEYGFTPELRLTGASCTTPWKWTLDSGVCVETHRLFFEKDGAVCSMRFELFFRPSAQPQPVILMIDVFDASPENLRHPELGAYSSARLPVERITEQGFAAALIHADDLCPDSPDTFTRGILELAPRQGAAGWGAIGAWAWGTSRVLDELERDSRFDAGRAAVLGVSRAGKTALWCGAQDERFAAVIAVVSGCGGASLLRGKTGEHIRHMTSSFPHWTCENYASFADREDELPVDQHMLLALCAPRPLYLSDAIEDDWADPHKAFEAAVLAGEAYRVLGAKGLSAETFPPVHEPIAEGSIAYHVRTGGHGLLPYDWEQYMCFLSRLWKA